MMECSAEGIWLGIIGWAFGYFCWYILTATGVWASGTSVWCVLGLSFGGALLGQAGLTIGDAYGAPGNLSTLWFVGSIWDCTCPTRALAWGDEAEAQAAELRAKGFETFELPA